MLLVVPLLVGAGIGALIGRWWAMGIPVLAAGAYLAWALSAGSMRADTPWPFVIVLGAIGVAGGVVVRRRAAAANGPRRVDDPPLPPGP
jgi:hypothetical protein